MHDLDYLLNENQVSEIICIGVKALQAWRVKGGGPRFVKIGGKSVRYQCRDLLEWIESNKRSSTSDSGEPFSHVVNLGE